MKLIKRLALSCAIIGLLSAVCAQTVVFPGLGPGLGQSINPFDPNYQQLVLRQLVQAEVDKENTRAKSEYEEKAKQLKEANIQQQATGQKLFELGPPAHKKVLDAAGNIVESPELVCPPLSVVPDSVTAPSIGIQSPNAPPDRIDQLREMIRVLKADLEAIKAKLGVTQ